MDQQTAAQLPLDLTLPTRPNKWDTLNKLIDVLRDGQWHTNWELVEKVGHRFGASILILRRGEGPDGEHWKIQGEAVRGEKPGEWRYRHVGYVGGYRTRAPQCPKCGTKMHIADVRNGDQGGECLGATTTEKQSTLLEQKTAQVEKMQETIEWQAGIIKRQNAELKRLQARTQENTQ